MNCIILSGVTDHSAEIVDKAQIQHIVKVLKLKVGDNLKVGLINDKLGNAIISSIEQDKITLRNIVLNISAPKKLNLIVVLAMPRPKVLRRLIMDMTAQGVDKIILLNSYKTEKSYWQSPMLNRLDEFIMEGLQQAVDTVPPSIELKKRFKPFVEDDLLSLSIDGDKNPNMVVAHPYTDSTWHTYKLCKSLPKVLIIGAEGGWIDYEINLLQKQGVTAVSFGQRILRTETAVNSLLGSWL